MPTYHMGCNDCFEDREIIRSIKLGPPESCSLCGSTNVEQIYYAPPILTKSEPKTIGHLGDRNRDAMSQGEFQDKTHQQDMRSALARKKLNKEKPVRPWWRPDRDTPDPRLATMTQEEKTHFVKTGSKPGHFRYTEGEN